MSSFTQTPMANPQVASGYYFDPDLLPSTPEGEAIAQQIFALIIPYAEQRQLRKEQDIATYSTEHEAYLMEMRKLQKLQIELNSEKAFLDTERIALDNETNTAAFNVRMARKTTLNPMWASKADWDEYNANVAAAKKVMDEVLVRYQDFNLLFASWTDRWSTLQSDMGNLAENVAKVFSKLERAKGNNPTRIDRSTGLVTA